MAGSAEDEARRSAQEARVLCRPSAGNDVILPLRQEIDWYGHPPQVPRVPHMSIGQEPAGVVGRGWCMYQQAKGPGRLVESAFQ